MKKTIVFLGLFFMGCQLLLATITVDGFCYLENSTDHSGTKVLFNAVSASAVTDSTFTNTDGSFLIAIEEGIYTVHYSHVGWQPYTIPGEISLFIDTTLDDITLSSGLVIEVSGPQSGTWSSYNLYQVIGDISVSNGDSLIIEPGVTVKFMDYYSFTIYGELIAIGTEADTIRFTSGQPAGNPDDWNQIEFNGSSASNSVISYAIIEYASTGIYCSSSSPTISNNTIIYNGAGDWNDVGISCQSSSSPTISNNTISNNNNHGILCQNNSSPTISNNTISNNYWNGILCEYWSSPSISNNTISNQTYNGIRLYESSPSISNNTISNNNDGIYCHTNSSPIISNNTISTNNNGIFCSWAYSSPTISNNTICNNNSGIFWESPSPPTIMNNILYDNSTGILVNSSSALLEYNLFWLNSTNGSGSGIPTSFGEIVTVNANGDPCDPYLNLFMDPLFIDPVNLNFHLTENSPCIDAGNPDQIYYDPDGTIADIGAFYFDQLPYFPNADFSANITNGIFPLIVDFSDLSTMGLSGNPIIEWFWDFNNDGTIDSYEQNPQWTYTEAGLYTVTLTVSDGSNTGTETKTDYITVLEPIDADFEAVPLIGLAPLDVQFTDLSTGGLSTLFRESKKSNNSKIVENDNSRDIVSWEWDFDNDGTIDSYLQNPNHTYSEVGVYTVSLTVSDGTNEDTEIKADYITVGEPIATDFEAVPLIGLAPLDVQFTDLSTGGLSTLFRETKKSINSKIIENDNSREIVSWEWDFNNDGTIDSYEQNPQCIYNEAGLYTVTLTVSDGSNTGTETKIDYITVGEPDIEFSYQTDGVIESGISLLSEDILYCAASGDCVYRFNNSGQIEYTLNVNGDIKSATTITPDHNVYIASTDYNLYSFNSNGVSNTGWPLSLGAEATASVASDSVGNIYIGTQNGIFQAVDPNGENIWSYNVGAPVYSSAIISSENTLYVTNTNGRLYAFDLNTINPGNVVYKWIIETNGAVSSTPALDDINNIYIANEDGQLIKINDDGINGNVIWTFESGSAIIESSPLIDSNYNVYFGCTNGRVYSVNNSGQLNWMSDEFDPIKSTGALFESDEIQSRIYIGSDNGKLYALSTDDGIVLWQFTSDSAIVCPILYNAGKIYFGTVNGAILVINDPDISTGMIFRNTSIWSTFQGNNLRTGYQTDNMTSVEQELINNHSYLLQNYPNPFNPTTTISFSIPDDSKITLIIYNIKGQEIKTLVNNDFIKGSHSVVWNGDDYYGNSVSSGIYFYELNINDKVELVRKCLLLK